MKAISIIPTVIGSLATLCSANAALPHLQADLTYAPNVPPPVTRPEPAIVEVDLKASHFGGQIN